MAGGAAGSYFTTARATHEQNRFSFDPIKEIAWLFAGLFAAMVPALDYFQQHASALGISSPAHFYWLGGALSGVLDNAPTYLIFLTAAFGQKGLQIGQAADVSAFLQQHAAYAIAISLGSVFFGAITYLGNGPNLMVKAIADQQGVHTPHFFRYIIGFSLPFLLPVLALVAWVFLR